MTAEEFLEQEYLNSKKQWSLPPVNRQWRKFAIDVMEKYAQEQVKNIAYEPVLAAVLTAEDIEQAADKLTDDERMELIGRYCKYCGDLDNTCQCWNDE